MSKYTTIAQIKADINFPMQKFWISILRYRPIHMEWHI